MMNLQSIGALIILFASVFLVSAEDNQSNSKQKQAEANVLPLVLNLMPNTPYFLPNTGVPVTTFTAAPSYMVDPSSVYQVNQKLNPYVFPSQSAIQSVPNQINFRQQISQSSEYPIVSWFSHSNPAGVPQNGAYYPIFHGDRSVIGSSPVNGYNGFPIRNYPQTPGGVIINGNGHVQPGFSGLGSIHPSIPGQASQAGYGQLSGGGGSLNGYGPGPIGGGAISGFGPGTLGASSQGGLGPGSLGAQGQQGLFGGFGQQGSFGGYGQIATVGNPGSVGGFGQGHIGGFGQGPVGGFGQNPGGGFGQGAVGGFGQVPVGGFGQVGGLGQRPIGGLGQGSVGGFGQGLVGGFGQGPPIGGYFPGPFGGFISGSQIGGPYQGFQGNFGQTSAAGIFGQSSQGPSISSSVGNLATGQLSTGSGLEKANFVDLGNYGNNFHITSYRNPLINSGPVQNRVQELLMYEAYRPSQKNSD